MVVIGLTGSIGMGKSTTAQMFRDCGLPVYDADAVVHELYCGAAVPLIEAEFPGTTVDGAVDRERLARAVLGDDAKVKKLESIVHPLVRGSELAFRQSVAETGKPAFVLDIPLLFETGGDRRCDVIVVVSAPADVQKARVLARPGMTEAKFSAILARQLPDAEKRRRAHAVIDTGLGMEPARRQVEAFVRSLRAMSPCAK